MSEASKNASERNCFTRMCIGEAIVSLLQGETLEKITVSEIAKKAGISRMTYYHYYDSKTAALEDYLGELIARYLEENRANHAEEPFHEYEHVLFSLQFFDQYAPFFLTMNRAGLYSIMIEAVNSFMVEQIPKPYPNAEYELFYYAGALLNSFIRWEEEGKKISAQELARIVCRFASVGRNTQDYGVE